jgi:hypothetical protein
MVVNLIIGATIFGYAGWSLVRFINRAKQGKCAGCHIENSCTSKQDCTTALPEK